MGESTIIIALILFNIFFVAFICGIIVFIRQYRDKKKSHKQELEIVNVLHKEEMLKTITEIQSETMKHIGREIHDNVGQKLTLSSLYLQQLVFENEIPEINNRINNVNDIINESLNELRQLSKSLTDDTIDNRSISTLIEEECRKINELKKCSVKFNNTLGLIIDSYQVKSVSLRVVQEFMQNSIKHSHCKQIDISLSNMQNDLQIILKDDGKGFDINKIKTKGIGLKNIQKRVSILNGNSILQSDEMGTKLTVKIPI